MFPILHHYEISPFSEKIRRILAYKQIAYHVVRAPAVMPKPDLTALTGGYRRIPVLQMGNHVYCDTALIARVLERVQPSPSLYPNALSEVVADWADHALFAAAAPVAMRATRVDELARLLSPEELSQIGADRAAMQGSSSAFLSFHTARAHLTVHLQRLDEQLSTGEYLCGAAPSIADFAVYHTVWFLTKLAPEPLEGLQHLKRWAERIEQLPDAAATPMTSADAIEVCRELGSPEPPVSGYMEAVSPSVPASSDAPAAASKTLARGQRAAVRALDYGRDEVRGEVVTLSDTEIALRRSDPRAGSVIVHFPRTGYEARPL